MNRSVSILLQKVQPLIAIALAWFFLGERLSKNFWVWTATALFGAYLVSFPNLVPQLYEGEAFNPNTVGALLALTAAVLWGASTVFGKFVLRKVSFQMMTSLRFVGAFVFLAILTTAQHSFPVTGTLTSTDWLFIGIIAITSRFVFLFFFFLPCSCSLV